MRVEVRPAAVDPDYQRGLDESFPVWGGRAASRWFFERAAGGPQADRLAMVQGRETVAGLGVTYRTLLSAGDVEVPVAILTGGWTRRQHRGRGCFRRLSEAAIDLAPTRGACLLLGFASRRRVSYRILNELGLEPTPARYLVAGAGSNAPGSWPSTAPPFECIEATPTPELVRRLFGRWCAAARGSVRVHYEDAESWWSQIFHRPLPCRLVRIGDDDWAVLEATADTDRVQLLVVDGGRVERSVELLRRHVAAAGRSFFLYQSTDRHDAGWSSLGLEIEEGAILVRLIAPEPLRRRLGLAAECGLDSAALLNDADPLYLGDWAIEGGDRM